MKSHNDPHGILDTVSRPILVIDRDFNVVDANAAFCVRYELSLENVVGRPCHALTHGLDNPCWQCPGVVCPVKTAFETHERVRVIHKHKREERIVVEEVVATPLEGTGYVIEELQDITGLLGLVEGCLPLCCSCKSVRDDEGHWHRIESYIHGHTGADLSHGLCPECLQKLYSEHS